MQWTNAVLDRLRTESDPEVDGMVGEYLRDRTGSIPELLSPMIRHVVIPEEDRSPEIGRWLAQKPPLPEWARPALIDEGVRFFAANGPDILLSLLLASLPECYAARKGVQVLHLTARLLSDPQRRLVETAQMVVDVMTPGGLNPGGRGYETARRVRLMHSGIRWLIASDPNVVNTSNPHETRPHYDPEWGTPINQEDLVGTLLTFSVVILDALEKMGEPVSREEAEAYHHAWNVVGFLIGVDPKLLPIPLDDARMLMDVIRTRHQKPCKEGQAMTAAALAFAQKATVLPWLQGLPAATMRHLIGNRTADVIDVPRPDWTVLLVGGIAQTKRLFSLVGGERVLRLLTADFNRRLVETLLVFGRGETRPAFDIPTHLADEWRVRRPVLSI